ncbi:unnamed protein product [Owenia fusiformis]|uniref:Phytanoyl-CoA dioxygenase n=1 Tax=Owenia fusiformis TaxID=6347 RepID=A0A8S4Q144_OWEFU|nr:unnamed protein product [Owenia fusiformis]
MPSQATEYTPGVPDWSTVHEPTGELFPPIQSKDEWERLKLTDEQVNTFHEQGFLLNVPVLTEEQCDKILDDYKYFMGGSHHPGKNMLYEYHSNQAEDPDNVLVHVLGHWRLTKLFHDLAFHPKIVRAASQLLGDKGENVGVRFWHDQLFAKPAKHGGVVAWHQDYSYWTRTAPMSHLTVHVALDDQVEDNGGLKYIPGSHRWTRNGGKPLPVLDFNFKDMEGIKTILTDEENAQFKPVMGLLKKGECSIHHALSVHGSYGNKSDRPRRAAVVNYFKDGVQSVSEEEMLFSHTSDETAHVNDPRRRCHVPKGSKMEGQFFPLVFDPAWVN